HDSQPRVRRCAAQAPARPRPLKRQPRPFTGRCRAASSLAPPGGAYDFLGVGAGAIGSATSEFQISWAISQRPFSCTQRTMYLPESTAGAPGGRLAAAGQAKCQRPRSTAIAPLAHTESARTVSTGGGLDIVFSTAKNAR